MSSLVGSILTKYLQLMNRDLAVFAGGPNDVSQSVVDLQVSNHKAAKVDTLGRGMKGYTSLNITGTDTRQPSVVGMKHAKNEHVILLNGQDMGGSRAPHPLTNLSLILLT